MKFPAWLAFVGWFLVVATGAGSLAHLAFLHGEHVNALCMVVASVCVFAIAYRFHSAWLMAKVLTLDELRATPAGTRGDGRDFVPTNRRVVFGHHFAIMFEALFILTTIDPLGGINSLWPIFGVANQLLAVIAFALGTTDLLKMGRVRYIWVTVVPLVWLLVVTFAAGWMKIFSTDPKLGFLSAAASFQRQLAAGGEAAQVEAWRHQAFNNLINAGVTGAFLILVLLVVGACARVWWRLLAGREALPLNEDPYVTISPA